MKCIRCGSLRMVKFVDGFGEKRIFCRKCWGSFLDRGFDRLNGQKNLRDFSLDVYYNPKAVIRHFR